MARADLGYNGRGKWCSYKRTTLILCTINIGVALYVLHSLYTSLYIYPYNDSQTAIRYTPDQIRKMEESIRIRKASEPIELVKLVKEIKKELLSEERQREAVESWRKEKLKANRLALGKTLNSSILHKEAVMLTRALDSNWAKLSEEIGLWIPLEIINQEHDDKPEGATEFEEEILPGRQLPTECHTELHADYDGAAVKWGLTHHKESAYECCKACFDHAERAKPGEKKCNIWVYCPSETGCYSPDKYEHKLGECWLKYAEKPRLNFKDKYSESYRNSHPNAPLIVPWVSGVVTA
ncbi:hypothetical protein F0562_027276 [Nyssa sinensis]|uniref:Apple domain-containing protein n=1 Tax=Nyssa sinensis TaxID=561372 RepID=A0A5J5B5C7_9ASTE|nr:hypothetical protein F0562_027276 [Nyssa sinensis]